MKASEIISKIKADKEGMEFLPTGFPLLDAFLDGGFMKKELIVLGAFTGVGKSAVAGTIFHNIAQKGFKSAYFSLEISNSMVIARLLGAMADIKPTRIMVGMLTPEEHNRRLQAEAVLEGHDSIMEFHDHFYDYQNIKKTIIDGGYDFVVVDFVQNVIVQEKDEYTRLSTVSLNFQKIAKDTNSCIVLLSQISNAAAKRDDLEYKGSGSIATVCDLGFFIQRADTTLDGHNQFRLILRKNRRGRSGVNWIYEYRNPGGRIIEVCEENKF